MSLVTRLLFVGGSFGGLSAVKSLVRKLMVEGTQHKIEITLIEPRAGLLNVLGIPRAIIDTDFAATTYFGAEGFNLKFNNVESNDSSIANKLKEASRNFPSVANLEVNFIHGKCTSFIDHQNATYSLNSSTESKQISFDYCVYATGRKRSWPFDPAGFTKESFLAEMSETEATIKNAETISIIGAGALGIEIAGEIKAEMPEKHIKLIHPYSTLPPEEFGSKNFREEIIRNVKEAGIDLILNTRISKEMEDGNLLTTNGEIIKSELTYWCNSKSNNVEPLFPYFKDSIDPKTHEVIVDENLLIKGTNNMFAVGDIVNLPIIKTAGTAIHLGDPLGHSLYNLVVKGKQEYERIDVSEWPRSMVIVVGSERTVCQMDDSGDGDVVINDKRSINMYKDYGNKKCKSSMEID